VYICLDSASPELIEAVRLEMIAVSPETPVRVFSESLSHMNVSAGTHILHTNTEIIHTGTVAGLRWEDLRLASKGVRRWTQEAEENSPTYAGTLTDRTEVHEIVADALFADGKTKYFDEFGVNYLGRTNLDPRTILVVDNKGNNKEHSPAKSPEIDALLTSLPEEWWTAFAIVSSGNVDKLGDFLDMLSESLPLVYTNGAEAKLKYLGMDYTRIGEPTPDAKYGFSVREASYRLNWRLAAS
jgi:hypothetical protein